MHKQLNIHTNKISGKDTQVMFLTNEIRSHTRVLQEVVRILSVHESSGVHNEAFLVSVRAACERHNTSLWFQTLSHEEEGWKKNVFLWKEQ